MPDFNSLASPENTRSTAMTAYSAPTASVTESAGLIWAELARRYGPSVVLLEHRLAPEFGEGKEILDLVRIGASGGRTGRGYGRPRRTTPVTPGWNSGWPPTGTR